MKIKNICVALAVLLLGIKASADEGMWLMQQLASQYAQMKERGLKLKDYDLYNPNGTSLKDAVVIFGRGCTGEVISSQGLVLTNHHCGYDAIQSLSSVEANYLEHGYWAQSEAEELPAKGLSVTFIEAIEDVTDYVQKALRGDKHKGEMDYLSPQYLARLAERKVGKALPYGTQVEIKAFFNGNRYLMFTKKVYTDIRFVGAPPSAIGKFGADTDNWVYPRHTGDFSIFRIYADADGQPAPYSTSNKPLKPKRWLNISTKGVEQGDFAMIMGFPGRTNRFFIPEEVEEWKNIDNDIRIRMRAIRQEVMLKEMQANPQVNIQYAAKYAYSQNGYKRAIGANWGIDVRNLAGAKRQQMEELLTEAQPKDKALYNQALGTIRSAISERASLRRRTWYLSEGFLTSMEFLALPSLLNTPNGSDALNKFFKDYNAGVDNKVTKAILNEYIKQLPEAEWPKALSEMLHEYKSVDALVDTLFTSHYTQGADIAKRLVSGQIQANKGDQLIRRFEDMLRSEYNLLTAAQSRYDNPIELARRTYVGGLLKYKGVDKLWPDANSTLRFTYGQVKGYSPRDGVFYEPRTTLEGVMQKADSTSWEFAVPKRLKEIYETESYGQNKRWAIRTGNKWIMPVNMCATTHTTGGNSGSPVLNAKGELIGINFDRNWEGVGGDIQYLPDYQRSIICDIRYIMMIIDEYGHCPRLIKEMTFVD